MKEIDIFLLATIRKKKNSGKKDDLSYLVLLALVLFDLDLFALFLFALVLFALVLFALAMQ